MKGLIWLLVFVPGLLIGQSYWSGADEQVLASRNTVRNIVPSHYLTYSLSSSEIEAALAKAPIEFVSKELGQNIFLPLPTGAMEEFIVVKSPVMEAPLAEKYPSIQSYKGYMKSNPSVTTRFMTGPNGFHAAIHTEEGMVYIDPYSSDDKQNYISYYTKDHNDPESQQGLLCGTDGSKMMKEMRPKWGFAPRQAPEKMEFRIYRLALACTGEWGIGRKTVEGALAEMVVFVDRSNIIFEAEVALRLVLIANNDKLIHLDPNTDPYFNSDKGLEILSQNTLEINKRVGSGSYEIGHIFSRCFDVGGVAGGQICTSAKGAGVTCHNGNSVTTGVVLIFVHEVGHQMTASHTFNKCGDTDQLALGTAYEPGSGSTIMAYPGACGSDNLGIPKDSYFHSASLDQMLSYTNSVSSDAYICAQKVDINNFKPEIILDYPRGFSIPRSTPFYLEGSATDIDNDAMTYSWEQFDNSSSRPLGDPVGNCPLFRSMRPSKSPKRYFPMVSSILVGRFGDFTEILPTYGRDLNFRFTVRDNNPRGSAAVWEDIKFNVASNAGPFLLTFPRVDSKFEIGESVNITWDVANTDIAPVNCKTVDIYGSYSNSLDFDGTNMVLLVRNTPNDGSQEVVIPNRVTNSYRIVVKASNNIFFTTSVINSRVSEPTSPSIYVDVENSIQEVCLPAVAEYSFSSIGLGGYKGDIKFEVLEGLPDGAKVAFATNSVKSGESNKVTVDLSEVGGSNSYEFVVLATAGDLDTIRRTLRINTVGTDLSFVGLISPENGIKGLSPVQKYTWEAKADATEYDFQVSTSPRFAEGDIVIQNSQSTTTYSSTTFLDKATVYFWRVRSSNVCKAGEWSEISAFNTEALACKTEEINDINVNISGSGVSKAEIKFDVTTEGQISDANIKNIKISHENVKNLVVSLISPDNTSVILWSRRCSGRLGVNIGLDDQSNDFFNCPVHTGTVYRPVEPLAGFNGKEKKGTWKLIVDDQVPGNGGRVRSLSLELCANLTLNPPVIINNKLLKLTSKAKKDITNDILLAEDSNNSAEQITYTIVKLPTKGTLIIGEQPAQQGDTYTQADINTSKFSYLHTASDNGDDSFRFSITDGEGGWVNITEFDIEIERDITSTNESDINDANLLVYPNPTNDLLHIDLQGHDDVINSITILSATGQKVSTVLSGNKLITLDMNTYSSGVYILKVETKFKTMYRKVIKK